MINDYKIKSSDEIEYETGIVMAKVSITCTVIFMGAVFLSSLVEFIA